MGKEQNARRLDYVWAAVVAKHYLDGIHENCAPDQAADSAVKRADQAEGSLDRKDNVQGDGTVRLDLIWALVAADEFNRLLCKMIDPSGADIRATADRGCPRGLAAAIDQTPTSSKQAIAGRSAGTHSAARQNCYC